MIFFREAQIFHVTGFLFFLQCLFSGCATTHTQFLSEHWVERAQAFPLAFGHSNPSRLQVIITYDGPLSSHSALRLVSDDQIVTFWDPAGAYGLFGHIIDHNGTPISPYGKREKDIVLTHIPDIPTYIRFRWLVGDSSVEIFEWDLPPQQIHSLQEVLHTGTNTSHPKGEFHTETAPAFCAIAISDFLQRFGTPTITLSESYLWPHNLGEALLDQSPSRIRLFFPQKEERVFVPPQPTLAKP